MIGKIGNVSFGWVWVKPDTQNDSTGRKVGSLLEELPKRIPGVVITTFPIGSRQEDRCIIEAPKDLTRERKDMFDSTIALVLEMIGLKRKDNDSFYNDGEKNIFMTDSGINGKKQDKACEVTDVTGILSALNDLVRS